MAKRRFNTKQIAKQPLLKKRMAKFCAYIDVNLLPLIPTQDKLMKFEDILANGHRGYISYSEDDLAKEFDKKLEQLRTKYSVMLDLDEKRKNERFYRKDDKFAEIEMWYEEAVAIANEVFEETFLS